MAPTTTETTESAESYDTDVSLWTEEQESALLQAIVRWKPVGMHKHFRMIAIREHLLQQGVVNPDDAHTSRAGIWRKLGSLYDLSKLDEREDSIIDGASVDDDGGSSKGGTANEYFRDFELPREDFEELMWQKRLAPEGTLSPDMSRAESTIPDTDEPARSSPVSSGTPATRSGSARGGRGSRRGGGGRRSRLQNEVETERSSSRRTSKANSVADEDQVMEDADSDEEAQESSEDEDEESEEEQEEEKKGTATRGGRGGRGRGRAKGARGRRR